MILSDLLKNEVHDSEGRMLGRVIDARFVIDGAPGELLADARLAGFVVSPRSGSSFLGYERTADRRPWLIADLLRRRHRGSFFVAWDDIARLSEGRVDLRPGFQRRSPSLEG
ncbi:PRC-barrel domain-containing protein [Cnuibacter sp. UC19_7]|uniref:PRC-barrel domain-containing protein n=1 Tax=Cnuibacter sp. UC19_7 TaxID=3350166 RepID=UPI00366EF00A